MFCIVGLGNPGQQYQQTRHNAGFLVVDRIAAKCDLKINKNNFSSCFGQGLIGTEKLFLVKPQTFMNLSGEAVSPLVSYFKIPLERLLIIYDDLDLPLGTIRIRLSGSAGGHNGLTSVIQSLGTNQIARIRVGIGRPPNQQPVPDYVLTPFQGEALELFLRTIDKAALAAVSFVTDGPAFTMNQFNQSDKQIT